MALALGAAVVGWLTAPPRPLPSPGQPLGLFTSLPLWWSEAKDLAAQIAAPAPPHWARAELEKHRPVALLDTLLHPARVADLIMAQPRPLEPQENVALDDWVRGGGHLLLFADPLLAWDSRFALGDRRRPQDTVLLGPILAHWGIQLRFDPDQPQGLREIAGTGLLVRLAGKLIALPGGDGSCRIEADGLIAECRIGKGRALIVADCALLEPDQRPARRARMLRALMRRAFAR